MCGLAGLIEQGTSPENLALAARTMADAIAYRGPDDAQIWVDPAAGYGVGFRRLAIVDLTPAGSQPMVSASVRSVITYNGEIYNAQEVAAELTGIHWRG